MRLLRNVREEKKNKLKEFSNNKLRIRRSHKRNRKNI
jgi:hypothetical protein